MKRLLPLCLLPLLAACEVPPDEMMDASLSGAPAVVAPAPLPPQVLAALPSGVPSSVVTRNVDGCYLLTIERTDPPTGYPLRDAAGQPVCEGSPAVAVGPLSSAPADLAPLAPASITPPAPLAPLNPG